MSGKSDNKNFDTTVKTEKNKRRKGKLFAVIFTLVLLVLGTYFCFTKLFIFKNFKVEAVGDNNRYTDEEIFEGSGLIKNVPLYSADLKAATDRTKYTLPFADVTFIKRFPSTIVARVNYRKAGYYINVSNNFYVLSDNLTVLEKTSDIEMIEANALTFLRFSDINKCVEGERLSLDAEIEEIFQSLVTELEKIGMTGRISEINMENKYDITLLHDTRYSIKIGDRSNLEKKLLLMKTVIEDKISVGETGSIDVTDEDIKIVVFKKH